MTDTLPIKLVWHNTAKEKPTVSGTYLVAIHYRGEIYCITDITYSAKYDTWNWRDYMGPQPDENRAQWAGRITHWASLDLTISTLQMAYDQEHNNATKD